MNEIERAFLTLEAWGSATLKFESGEGGVVFSALNGEGGTIIAGVASGIGLGTGIGFGSVGFDVSLESIGEFVSMGKFCGGMIKRPNNND